MADRPIFFSGPMVRALIEGRKTQTRRIVKHAPHECLDGEMFADRDRQAPSGWSFVGAGGLPRSRIGSAQLPALMGDRLWVRETFTILPDGRVAHKADYPAMPISWQSPIHMPRRLSRLTLVVTDVRVQRLQDISPDDIEAEGCLIPGHHRGPLHDPHRWRLDHFASLWDQIHGRGAWERNPWVAALTFTVHHGNIDAAGPPSPGGG